MNGTLDALEAWIILDIILDLSSLASEFPDYAFLTTVRYLGV